MFQHLINFPEEEDRKVHDIIHECPHRARRICKDILRRFPNLAKFLEKVRYVFGELTVQELWCRIWGTLELERKTGSTRTAFALSHLKSPETRPVHLRHAKRPAEEIIECVEALEQLVFV